jgi:hypothetical protein
VNNHRGERNSYEREGERERKSQNENEEEKKHGNGPQREIVYAFQSPVISKRFESNARISSGIRIEIPISFHGGKDHYYLLQRITVLHTLIQIYEFTCSLHELL